jgi:hypothetical protein
VLAAFRRSFPRPFVLEANHPDPGALVAVLPQPDRVRRRRVVNGATRIRSSCAVKHDAGGKLYSTRC